MSSPSYITGAQLAAHLGVPNTSAEGLDAAAAAASRAIDQVCGRRFFKDGSATARVYRPLDERLVEVDDIADTTGLVVKTDADSDGTFETTWAATDFTLEPLNNIENGIEGWPYYAIRVVWGRWWPWWRLDRPTVQVTAIWGWAAVPDAVIAATKLVAADLWKRKDAPFGVAGFGDLGVIRIKNDDTLIGDNGLLRRYVKSTGFSWGFA